MLANPATNFILVESGPNKLPLPVIINNSLSRTGLPEQRTIYFFLFHCTFKPNNPNLVKTLKLQLQC